MFSWFLLAPAILPILYIDGLLYPYVTPKTLLFRGFGIIAVALFAYLAFSRHQFYWGRLRQKFSWIPGALLLVAYTTSAFGVDFYHSFWSTFDRGDGLLTLSIATLFFYLVLLFADRKFFSKLLKIVALVGTFVALHALLQWVEMNIGIDLPFIAESRGRLGGTLGNAAFLASYLGMTAFATFAVVREYAGGWRRLAYGAAVLQMVIIFLTATRGTMLALMVLGVVALVYFAFKKEERRMMVLAQAGLLALAIFTSLFFVFRTELSKLPFEPVSRIASLSVDEGTVSSRLFVWRGVFDEALKQPFAGYGAEHIDILFNRVYDPGAISEQWFDRSHNAFLDYFVQYGIAGLLLYLGMIFVLAIMGWRIWKEGNSQGAYFIAISGVYAIQNFFVFDTAMTLWVLLVFTAGILAVSSTEKSSSIRLFPHAPLVGGFLAAGALFLLVPVFFMPLRANLLLADGYRDHIADVSSAVKVMKKGLSLETYADLEYGYQAYVMYTERQVRQLSGNDRIQAYQYTLEVLTKNFKRYPYDARTATYLAHVIDLAPPEVSRNSELLLQTLDRATELSPKRTQPWFLRANIFIRKGDMAKGSEKISAYKDGVSTLKEYIEHVPNESEARYVVASLYLAMGNRADASRFAEDGARLYNGNIAVAHRAVHYYISIEDWANALRFLKDVVEEEPEDYESVYDLAKLYFLTNDREMSLKIFERLKKEKPEILETDLEFLRAIEST